MSANYRAMLMFTFERSNSGAYQELIAALKNQGWSYLGRGSFHIQKPGLKTISRGIESVLRRAARAGLLATLSLSVQACDDRTTFEEGFEYAAARNYPFAS